jgi:biotin carboxylase
VVLKTIKVRITSKENRFMKINPRFSGILMSFMVAFGMSLVMSFVMVAANLGFSEKFLSTWVRAWLIGLAVGFPAAAVLVPAARRVVSYLTSDLEPNA